MKGRDTIDDLRHFFEDVVVRCFTLKYALYYKERQVVKNAHDLALYQLYHQQTNYFPG